MDNVRKIMKKLTILFSVLILILLASGLSAAKPDTQVFTGNVGFEIKIPDNSLIRVGTNETFHFHLFNLSNGVPIYNDTTQCHFHLYTGVGGHLYKLENITEIHDTFDFEVKIDGNNFSNTGMYSYIFQCQDYQQDLGGFIDVQLTVTSDGEEPVTTNSTAGIAIIIFILIVTLTLFLLPFLKKDFAKNQFANLLLKRSCWLIAIYLMMFNSVIVATIANSANLPLTSELFRYMWLFGTMGYVFMGFVVLKTLLEAMELWKLKKHKKRMGEDDD